MNPQLNEWNLPHGMTPHNPDNLTPEQITEGGKYRPLAKCEVDELYHEVRGSGYYSTGSQEWRHYDDEGEWVWDKYSTIRVPITTPLPAVKESLTPQPAPDVAQKKTRTLSEVYGLPEGSFQAFIRQQKASGYSSEEISLMGGIEGVLKSRKEQVERLQTELTAAMAERDEARETLDLMCDEFQRIKALAGLPLEAHTFCERAISGIKQRVPLVEQRDKAEKERDEARRLLVEADEAITLLIRHDDIESREHAQALNKALNAQTHITNHLNK